MKNIQKVKKKKFVDILLRKKEISGIRELFANTSYLTNIIPIPIRKFGNSQTFPIPIFTECGSPNISLFLFAGKITICWSLCHYFHFYYRHYYYCHNYDCQYYYCHYYLCHYNYCHYYYCHYNYYHYYYSHYYFHY